MFSDRALGRMSDKDLTHAVKERDEVIKALLHGHRWKDGEVGAYSAENNQPR